MNDGVAIIPLGTGSAVPKRGRHFASIALERPGEVILFDCGEGTQMQLLESRLRPSRLSTILISHLHGDHYYGLPGLLATLSLNGRTELLRVVAPRGLGDILSAIPGTRREALTFPVDLTEFDAALDRQTVIETDTYHIELAHLDHGVLCAGFRFEERPQPGNLDVDRARALGIDDFSDYRALKAGQSVQAPNGTVIESRSLVSSPKPGATIAYATDTRPCASGIWLAREADVLLHEATFTHDLHDKAIATGHSTAREAAEVAREAGARALLLFHASSRYEDRCVLVDEAREVFPPTELAEELERYRVLAGAGIERDTMTNA